MNRSSFHRYFRSQMNVNSDETASTLRDKITNVVVVLIVVVVGLALFVPRSSAQDTPPELTCDIAGVNNMVADWTFLDQIAAARDAGDVETLYQVIINTDLVIDVIRQACNPLHWEGEEGSRVLDPVFIEQGVYRLIITGERNDRVTGEILMGECDSIFTHISGAGNTSGEDIFRSNGCLLLLDVSSGVPWTLTFEKVG